MVTSTSTKPAADSTARTSSTGAGHVDPDDPAARADLASRDEAVEAAASAEIEHRFAVAQRSDGGRVAATQAEVSAIGNGRRLVGAVAQRRRGGAHRAAVKQ